MLSKKHYRIIKYLNDQDIYLTSQVLAQKLGVSSRTVKRYVEDINYEIKNSGVGIISTKGVGYRLIGPPKTIQNILKEALRIIEGFEADDSIESRVENTICLFINNDYLSADELADKLNLSTSSINKMTSRVKECLAKYNLRLISKPYHGTCIEGEELNIRSLILDYGIKYDDNNNLKVYLSNITNENIEKVEEIVETYLKRSNIIVADKDFNNLLSSILVAIPRTKNGNNIGNLFQISSYRVHNYIVIHHIMTQIQERLSLTFDENEFKYVSLYSGFMIYNYGIKNAQLEEMIHKDLHHFIYELLDEIKIITGNEFHKDLKFISALAIHIKIAINRAKTESQIKNPLLLQIKSNYPVEMNFAMFTAKKIHDHFAVKLNEDEIGFIAMHFAAAQERINIHNTKKICILCHYGIGTAQLLAEKIKKYIKHVEIIGVYPVRYLDLALAQNVNYIISTVKIEDFKGNVPMIIVDNVLSDASIKKIDETISVAIREREVLYGMFNEKAFYRMEAHSKEEVIEEMGRRMIMEGLIDSSVIASVLEREKMLATDIGHMVAIPHSPINGIHKSVICVTVLDKPILWKSYEVQLVFMICFNLADRKNFEIFKYMYNLIENTDLVKSIMKAQSFHEFIQMIKEGI